MTALLADAPPDARIEARWALQALTPSAYRAQPGTLAAFEGRYGAVAISPANDGLQFRQERRPAAQLVPIGPDLFTVADDLSRRVRFERDATGRVIALEQLHADGTVMRRSRS